MCGRVLVAITWCPALWVSCNNPGAKTVAEDMSRGMGNAVDVVSDARGATHFLLYINDETLRSGEPGQKLADELRALSGSDRFGFLAEHRGMFSRLGTTPDKVDALREKHAVYMVGDSRLNIAGLNSATIPVLAKAIIDCGI